MSYDQEAAEALCNDLFTTASALSHVRNELNNQYSGKPLEPGFRNLLLTLIDRNQELVDEVLSYMEGQKPTEVPA
ncbi:MAG: hypothetical protein C0524_19060 [Rhodobacter sp.]|nr:hypothetical protein [Rhodobacter sp.]